MKEKVLFFFSVFFLSLLMAPSVRSQLVWQTESSAGFTPNEGMTSAVVNGKIYVVGGARDTVHFNTLQVFDPVANSWSTPVTTGTFTTRYGATSAVVNGKIYVLGGEDSYSNLVNTLEVFDPSSNTWSAPVTMGTFTPRAFLTSAVVNDKIYVFGGMDSVNSAANIFADNILEVFDPSTNAWSTPITTGVFTPREGPTSAVLDGKIYVIAGLLEADWQSNIVEVYDPSDSTWSTPTTFGILTPRCFGTSDVVDGKIYVIGGGGFHGETIPIDMFDTSTNNWSIPATTGTYTQRALLTSAVVDGSIYTIGGVGDSAILNTNEALMFEAESVAGNLPQPTFLTIRPNPITDHAIISFNLSEPADVSVEIHDELGRLVSTLANEEMPPGPHQLTWQPDMVAAGCYVCILKSVRLNIMERCKLALMR